LTSRLLKLVHKDFPCKDSMRGRSYTEYIQDKVLRVNHNSPPIGHSFGHSNDSILIMRELLSIKSYTEARC